MDISIITEQHAVEVSNQQQVNSLSNIISNNYAGYDQTLKEYAYERAYNEFPLYVFTDGVYRSLDDLLEGKYTYTPSSIFFHKPLNFKL